MTPPGAEIQPGRSWAPRSVVPNSATRPASALCHWRSRRGLMPGPRRYRAAGGRATGRPEQPDSWLYGLAASGAEGSRECPGAGCRPWARSPEEPGPESWACRPAARGRIQRRWGSTAAVTEPAEENTAVRLGPAEGQGPPRPRAAWRGADQELGTCRPGDAAWRTLRGGR